MEKPKVFVGSSGDNANVARAIALGLEDSAEVTVWDEGVFRLTHAFLEDLLAARSRYDFAVMVWAPDDITESKGETRSAPRDNVVFECGLFMGALGPKHVFVVHDKEAALKIPTDFAGITLAPYDAGRMGDNPQAAVRRACDLIKGSMSASLDLTGEWRQRYTEAGDIVPKGVEEDIEVSVFADIVSFKRQGGPNTTVVFSARGRLAENRIRGEWRHGASTVLGHGAFLLVVNGAGDVLYGYSASYDATGGAVFEAWVLAKKTGRKDEDIAAGLAWGEQTLKARTVGLLTPDVAAG